jgi:hypothetical protein
MIFPIGAYAKNPLPKAPPACGLVKTPRGVPGLAAVEVTIRCPPYSRRSSSESLFVGKL